MINYDYGRLTGEIITREDFEYEEERKAWNRAIEKYPLIIVYCKTEDDIKTAIIIAKANSLSIRIRNGRHHYEGYSNGNDVVVIDVSKMNKIYMDEENERVKKIRHKQVSINSACIDIARDAAEFRRRNHRTPKR